MTKLRSTLAVAVLAASASLAGAQTVAGVQIELPTQAAHLTAAAMAADYEVWHDARCAAEDFPRLRSAAMGECHILAARNKADRFGQVWDSSYIFIDADGSVARTLRVAFVDGAQTAAASAAAVAAELTAALGPANALEIPLPGRQASIQVWDDAADQVRLGVAPLDQDGQQMLVLQAIRRH
ncbi:MAG: hypothetical protein RR758_05975 [Burkholderiaceae bacterium]